MKTLSCAIIEDEPLLANVIKEYIEQVPFLEFKKAFTDAINAAGWLKENPVDLVFLDINLPKLKGIEFIRHFQGHTKFIITTAYHEYAVEGFELNVADYLLKPVEFSRFMQAVQKAAPASNPAAVYAGTSAKIPPQKDHLFISVNKKRLRVNFADIVFIESMKEYVKLHLTKDKWVVTKLQIGQIEEMLNENFVRIHRSFIVSKKKVTAYNLAEVIMDNRSLPVGTNYKPQLEALLET